MKTITFDDGYTVTITENFSVTWTHQGKEQGGVHASHFRPVPETGKAADFLRKNGKSLADYLFAASNFANYLLRATNGVREAVAEATETAKVLAEARTAQQKEMRQKAIAEDMSECPLVDPVMTAFGYFDGEPTHVMSGGREIRSLDWSKTWVKRFSWIERAELERAVAQYDAAKSAEQTARAELKRLADERVAEKVAEARATGKPVMIEMWTTTRCMNGHSNECSFDKACRYAMPDGTIKVRYTCCY